MSQVEIFKDINYANGDGGTTRMLYNAGDQVACMDLGRRNPSIWAGFGFGAGDTVRNDEISSIKVPAGLKITCWWDRDYQGEAITFTSDIANIGNHWNDQITSFKVENVSPPIVPPPPIARDGHITFKNNTSDTLFFYTVIKNTFGTIDFCVERVFQAAVAPNGMAPIGIPANYIMSYWFYTNTVCDAVYQKFYGSLISSQAIGQTININ